MAQSIRTADLWGALTEYERKHAPEMLYAEGEASLLVHGVWVALVGSREAANAGLKRAESFTEALSSAASVS